MIVDVLCDNINCTACPVRQYFNPNNWICGYIVLKRRADISEITCEKDCSICDTRFSCLTEDANIKLTPAEFINYYENGWLNVNETTTNNLRDSQMSEEKYGQEEM